MMDEPEEKPVVIPNKRNLVIFFGFIVVLILIGFFIGYYFPRLW